MNYSEYDRNPFTSTHSEQVEILTVGTHLSYSKHLQNKSYLQEEFLWSVLSAIEQIFRSPLRWHHGDGKYFVVPQASFTLNHFDKRDGITTKRLYLNRAFAWTRVSAFFHSFLMHCLNNKDNNMFTKPQEMDLLFLENFAPLRITHSSLSKRREWSLTSFERKEGWGKKKKKETAKQLLDYMEKFDLTDSLLICTDN